MHHDSHLCSIVLCFASPVSPYVHQCRPSEICSTIRISGIRSTHGCHGTRIKGDGQSLCSALLVYLLCSAVNTSYYYLLFKTPHYVRYVLIIPNFKKITPYSIQDNGSGLPPRTRNRSAAGAASASQEKRGRGGRGSRGTATV